MSTRKVLSFDESFIDVDYPDFDKSDPPNKDTFGAMCLPYAIVSVCHMA
jgi:hypothetical protein